MTTHRLLALAIVLVCFSATALEAQATTDPHVASLIANGQGPYTEVAPGVWDTPYQGKNMGNIKVRIATAEGGVFFFVDLFPRENLALSRNLLLRIAELNSLYDYIKIALSDTALQVRLDARARLLDQEEFEMLEKQAASAADEAFLIIKDYLP